MFGRFSKTMRLTYSTVQFNSLRWSSSYSFKSSRALWSGLVSSLQDRGKITKLTCFASPTAFLLILSPVQTAIIKHLFAQRKKAMVWTDKRARLLQELLGGMKVVKLMAWEIPFLQRLDVIRKNELKYIRKLMVTRSGNMAIAMSSRSIL
jgi:hypothetical protein